MATLLTGLADAFFLAIVLIYAALLTSLLVLLRILAGRFMDALLASVKAAFFFHALIAISIVSHIFFPLLFMVDLRLWAFPERPAHWLINQPVCQPEH